MSNAAAETAAVTTPTGSAPVESTLTRSDVEWTPGGGKACDCGAADCLICEVESLAGN